MFLNRFGLVWFGLPVWTAYPLAGFSPAFGHISALNCPSVHFVVVSILPLHCVCHLSLLARAVKYNAFVCSRNKK